MLTLIPWYYRAAAIVALVIAVWLHGYVHGLHEQEKKDEAAFAQIRAEQDELAIHAGRVALDRSQAVSSIVDTYEAQSRNLKSVYDQRLERVRSQAANRSTGTLPGNPLPAGTAAGQPGGLPACAADQCLVNYAILEGNAADCAVRYKNLREAAKEIERIK